MSKQQKAKERFVLPPRTREDNQRVLDLRNGSRTERFSGAKRPTRAVAKRNAFREF